MKISHILAISVVLMIAGISTGGATPGQLNACDNCHTISTAIIVTTDVSTLTVSPGQAFKVNITWSGGNPAGTTEVNWPNNFAGNSRNNNLFSISPRVPANASMATSGTTNSTLTAPTTAGPYIVRVYVSTGNLSIQETNFKDMNITVQATTVPNAPGITANPATSTVSDTPGATRTFSITANQTVNVTWLINGTQAQPDNTSVTTASYTNTSAVQGTWNVTAVASNANGTAMQVWTWNVSPVAPAGPPSITNISPTPPAPPTVPTITDAVNATRTFSITVNQTVDVIWSINGTQVGTNTGVTTASYTNTSAALGTWNVTAVASNANGTATQMWNWIVQPPALASIAVSPVSTSVPQGTVVNFTASPKDQSGNPINAVVVAWSSSNTTVGTIDATTGVFTALMQGNTMISATNGTITGIASATVTAPTSVLTSIVVSPASKSVLPGTVVNFTASSLDQLGSPINATISWSVNDTMVGTIDPATGMFTAVAPGNVMISATNGTITGTANVTVLSTAVTAFGLTPDATAVLKGNMVTITITALNGISPQTLYNGMANITIAANNASAVASPMNASFTNGMATITVKSSIVQPVTVTATNGSITGNTTIVFADSVIPLAMGWNLISIPSTANPNDAATALENVQYNAIFSFDPANVSFSTPTVLQPLFGYWINVTAPNQSIGFIADTTVPSPLPERDLLEGWNLIGVSATHTDPVDMTAGDLFEGLKNNQIGKFYSMLVSYEDVQNPQVFSGASLTSNTILKQGHGYWLFINPIFNRQQNSVPWAGKPW